MKKYIIALLALSMTTPFVSQTHAAEVICPADWQASYGCNQCFQFYLTDADLAFSSSDVYFARGNLDAGQTEDVWLSDSTITGYAMQGANIGPVGNIKNLYEFPHDEGTHPTTGKKYSSFGPGESKTWARMLSGTAIGVIDIPDNIDLSVPIYRIEYTTISEIEEADGSIKPNSVRNHKECAMYSYVGLQAANAAIEIIKDDNDNHDDYQEVVMSGYASGETHISGEAGFGSGTARFWIEVRNTGGATLRDVYVSDDKAPDCARNIGTLEPGESVDYVCTDSGVTKAYTNTAKAHGRTAGGQEVSDEDDSYVGVPGARPCSITVNPKTGNAPLNSNISCNCYGVTNVRIIIGQLGNVLASYDGLSTTHTFNQTGTYDALCIPNGDESLAGKTTVTVTKSCGNHVVEAGETCDDGNMASGDGCSASCQVEACGNGLLDAGEQCDDGNNNNGDACTNICQRNTPPTGPEDMIIGLFFLSAFAACGWMIYRRKKFL